MDSNKIYFNAVENKVLNFSFSDDHQDLPKPPKSSNITVLDSSIESDESTNAEEYDTTSLKITKVEKKISGLQSQIFEIKKCQV